MLKRVINSLVNLLYPPLCLHCDESIDDKTALFCSSCQTLLTLIPPEERCSRCFSLRDISEQKLCSECRQNFTHFTSMAAAFDYMGPAATLVKKMKYADQPYLSRGGGAFLAAQFLQLQWPVPDIVIPVPMSLLRWLDRGYNQSELLARQLAEILSCPVDMLLKRHSGDYSQAGLSKAQRKQLHADSFYIQEGANLSGKTILLIDDVMTSGTTLAKCAEVLSESCPKALYGLTLCRAI